MTEEPTIRITVNGKPALTIAQAAERHGMPASGLRTALTRLPDLKPAANLDGRTPLYYVTALDRALANRPRGKRSAEDQ
jgi:hypothetical protein